MNATKYRKIYLLYNWGSNMFKMVKCKVTNYDGISLEYPYYYHNHPLVESGSAYWIKPNKLCVGYELIANPQIFRPIFSYKRQKILDKINSNIHDLTIYWNKVKSQYFVTLAQKKELPLEIIRIIVMFIY